MSDELDCVVVGAGVIGLAIPRRFALAGCDVVVLEQERVRKQVPSLCRLVFKPTEPINFPEGWAWGLVRNRICFPIDLLD